MDPLSLLIDPLQYRFFARALGIAMMLGLASGLIGVLLVGRRVVLMADSFGHALLPGVAVAFLLFGPGLIGLFAGALAAGISCVAVATLVARTTRLGEDAAFGSLFICSFALGIGLMSHIAAPMDLLHYLFGNLLGVGRSDLVLSAIASALTVGAVCVAYRPLVLSVTDPPYHRACGGHGTLVQALLLVLVATVLVASLQAIGLVLALGLVILPATTAHLWCERIGSALVLSAGIGMVGALIGLYASYHLNLPSGPCLVGTLGLGFAGSLLLAPRHGLIAAWRSGFRSVR